MALLHPLEQRWLDALPDLDERPIYEWAAECLTLSPPITKHGPFDPNTSRHFLGPFDAWKDDRTREVNVLKPPRGGGSLIGDICLVWSVANDPGPSMDVFQKDPVSATHFRERIRKMLRQCEKTRAFLPRDERKQNPPEVELLNGYTMFINGPSIANLQTKGIRYMRLDECWLDLFKYGTIAEADGRLGDYKKLETSKLLCISQGGPESGMLDNHEWYNHWLKGEANEWSVECKGCGGIHELRFFGKRADGTFWGVTWDQHKLANGDWNVSRSAATARFECPHKGCGYVSTDEPRTRANWNRTGRYVLTTEPNIKRRGFHYEALVDTKMTDLAALWLECENAARRGVIKPKIQFYQKALARFMDEQLLLRISQNFARAVYDLQTPWTEEACKFMSIDRQEEDVYWWTVRSWAKSGKSRRLGFGKAFGPAELEEIRLKHAVPISHTFLDSAYQPKGDRGVYAICLRYGWIAVRGEDVAEFVHHVKRNNKVTAIARSYSEPAPGDPESGKKEQGRRFCAVVRFSKPLMNGVVQRLIDNGLWEEPAGVDGELEQIYSEQMAGRIRKEEYNPKTGKTKIFWWESKNDHARDLANMQAFGATVKEILPDTLSSIEVGAGPQAQSPFCMHA